MALPDAVGAPALTLLAFAGGFAAAAGMVIVTGVAVGGMVATDFLLPLARRRRGDGTFRRTPPSSSPRCSCTRRTRRTPSLPSRSVSWAGLCPAVTPGSPFDLGAAAQAVVGASDAFTSGAILSLALNIAALTGVSFVTNRSLAEREDAARFAAAAPSAFRGGTSVGDLSDLLASVTGEEEPLGTHGFGRADAAPPALVAAAEARLSRVLGNASAHVLIKQLSGHGEVGRGEVLLLASEASRGLRAGRTLLAETLENLAEGVSMIDADWRLVAWNRALEDLLSCPQASRGRECRSKTSSATACRKRAKRRYEGGWVGCSKGASTRTRRAWRTDASYASRAARCRTAATSPRSRT